MTIPHVIVFDLGKVLLDFDYHIAAQKIAARGRGVAKEVTDLLLHTPLLLRYESGSMSKQEFYHAVCAGSGFCGDLEEFAKSFGDIFTPIEPMIQLQASLRRHGYRTYVFSNTNELAVNYIRGAFPFFGNFDGYVYSYEHGVMKPDAAIYQVLERQSGRRGADILYIDDRLENVDAGGARGWQTILQESPDKTLAEIHKRGLLNHNAR